MENKISFFDSVLSIFNRGCESNDHIVKNRTEVYLNEIKVAQGKIESKELSWLEKRYYKKQKAKAMENLENADISNKMFIEKTIASIAITTVAIYKAIELFKNSK